MFPYVYRSFGGDVHRRVAVVMLAWFLSAGSVLAEPMRLDDPNPRWVQVEFEISPSKEPGRLDSTYTPKALAWFEPGGEPGRVQVTVPGRVVEQHLLVKQSPKTGSFSDYVWLFDVATGHVESATVSGILIRTLHLGFWRPKLEADIRAEMATNTEAGFRPPKRLLGQTVFRYCSVAGKKGCKVVAPTALDSNRGYVNAVGVISARSGIATTHTFSPIGEAIFTEVASSAEVPDLLTLGEAVAFGGTDLGFGDEPPASEEPRSGSMR